MFFFFSYSRVQIARIKRICFGGSRKMDTVNSCMKSTRREIDIFIVISYRRIRWGKYPHLAVHKNSILCMYTIFVYIKAVQSDKQSLCTKNLENYKINRKFKQLINKRIIGDNRRCKILEKYR